MSSLTVLEVSDKRVTVVAARAAGHGVEILRAESVDVATPEDLAKALEKAGNGDRRVVLVVPRPLAILRDLELPDSSMDDLVPMVRFQIERDLPIAMDQVYCSFAIAARAGGKVKIHVAAVPKDALDPILASVEASGRKVSAAYVSTFGLINLAHSGEAAAAVVGMTGGSAEILVVDGGHVTVSRSAPLREGEALADLLATEIDRTIMAHQARSPGREVGSVLVAGEDAALVESIRAKLPRNITALAMNGQISRGRDVVLGLHEAAAAGICLGTLVHHAPMPDLLHPPVVVKRFKFGKAYRIGALAAAIMILAIGYMQMALSDRQKDLDDLKTELKAVQPRAAEVTRMSENTKRALEWGDKRYPWPLLFREMTQAIHTQDLFLLNATFEDTGTVRLTGKAKTSTAVNAYFDKLQKMKYFRDLKVEDVKGNSDKGEYRNDFQIVGKWIVPDK